MHYLYVLSSLADHKLLKGRAFISSISVQCPEETYTFHTPKATTVLLKNANGGSNPREWVGRSGVGLRNLLFLLLRVLFHSVGIFRTSRLGDSISGNPERTALRRRGHGGARRGEESGYTEVCNKGRVVWTSKVFLWIKKTRLSQKLRSLVLSTFLCMGRFKCWGSLKSFLPQASQRSGASMLRFFTSWILQCSPREGLQGNLPF